ncbi:PAS domain S-box protein [Candidatus Aerophobetes bacterium]|uniref:PAS domain S-box protein n=1 Tax=Aerophobetes bacterium TaxID=2030807 RepID=A0A523RY58_UNCAE|nr:MAG: PAS domain S-box protein [Candidatus Aerophobetes bacterium]
MTWNIWNIIRLNAFIVYSLLLFIVIWRAPGTKLVRAFTLYLISMVIWSLGSFLMHAEFHFGVALFWNKFMLGGIAGYLMAPGWFLFIGLATFNLIQSYRKARDSFYRNRLKYLLAGILIMGAGLTTNLTKLGRNPLDISINIINALLIAYVIFRYKLIVLTPAIAAESIVETMSDSLLLMTPEGKIKTVNPATLNLLGYKENELIDQPVEILFAKEKLSKGKEFDDLTKKEAIQTEHKGIYRVK